MTRPPALAHALLRALLPRHEIADALEGDLAEGFARLAATSPAKARWWYRRKVLTLPYVALNREIGRLRKQERSTSVRRGGGWMGGWTTDLRIAVRSLTRRPTFAGVAVATLALSVGAATLLYSVVDGVLMTPLPYERPDELVTVYLTSDEWRTSDNELMRAAWDVQTMTLDHARAFREASGPIAGISAYTYRHLPLDADDGSDEAASAIMVDGHTFDVLGVTPAMGRLPTRDEVEAAVSVAVLRHATWISRFGGDPEVLGRPFGFGEDTYTVIGVMPPGFFFPTEDGGDLWIPVREEARDWPSYYGVARLAPDGEIAEATTFLERVSRRIGEDDPERAGFGARAVPHLDNVVGSVRGGIRLLFGTALVVVLVACVNLANLFLARAAGRRQELAVRASLGADAGSLVTVMLSEAVVIGLVGGGLGIALAAGAIDPFVHALGTAVRGLPRSSEIGLHGGVLFFSLIATFATTVVAGLGPTVSSARRAPASTLGNVRWSGSSAATRRSQRLLLVAQAALTVVLVSAAGLLGRSFLEAAAVDMGMEADRVAVLEVEAEERYGGADAFVGVQEDIRARMSALPGVSSAGLAWSLPSTGGVLLLPVRPENAPAEQDFPVASVFVGGAYFESLGIPVLAGRGLRPSDRDPESPKVVISEALAARYFEGTDAVGRHVVRGSGDDRRTMEIVGVVADARQLSPFQAPEPTVYYPIGPSQSDHFYVTMAVEGDPAGVLEIARAALLSVDPALRVTKESTLRRMLLDGMSHIRLRMLLMSALAGLAAVLAMIGISGVVAHYLSEQTRVVGIRMALGAAAPREVGRVVRHALSPTILGLGVGVGVAIAASRVMESFVFGIEPTDPVTFAMVATVMLMTAGFAAWIPARRAATVDPARVLQGE